MSRPNLTKEQILFWIYRFRKLNPKRLEHRRRLINSFLNSVYLYDDKIIIDCNYKDGTETITLEEIENSALCSNLTLLGAPPPKTLIGFPYKCFVVSGVYVSPCEQLFFVRFFARLDFFANIFTIQLVCHLNNY